MPICCWHMSQHEWPVHCGAKQRKPSTHGVYALVEGVTNIRMRKLPDNCNEENKVNVDSQTNSQTDRQGWSGVEEEGKERERKERLFCLFFFFLDGPTTLASTSQELRVQVCTTKLSCPAVLFNLQLREGEWDLSEMTFQFRFEVICLGMWGKETVCGHSCKDSVIHKLSKLGVTGFAMG